MDTLGDKTPLSFVLHGNEVCLRSSGRATLDTLSINRKLNSHISNKTQNL